MIIIRDTGGPFRRARYITSKVEWGTHLDYIYSVISDPLVTLSSDRKLRFSHLRVFLKSKKFDFIVNQSMSLLRIRIIVLTEPGLAHFVLQHNQSLVD